HVGVGNEIEITLPVARFHVFQAVPFFGHGEQRLSQMLDLLDVHGKLAGARAEEIAFHADDVPDIDLLVQLEIALTDLVLLDVDLESFAILYEMREASLAHPAQRLHASGDAHTVGRRQRFGRLRAELGQDFGHGASVVESLAVRAIAQTLDLFGALNALLQQFIFQRQFILQSFWGNTLLCLLDRSISIIIPAYNEEKRLPQTLEQIAAYLDRTKWAFSEIIVVDDGSADGTAAVGERFAKSRPGVRVLRNPGNRGKGYSVRHGMLEAEGAWALFSDA